MIERLQRLYGHLFWADARAIEALRAAKTTSPKALKILNHIWGAEEVWLSRLQQRKAEIPVWPALSIEESVAVAERRRAGFEAHLASLTESDLARSVAYTNSAGQSFESNVWDILLHVAMHGSYHRGQVMLLLRESGDEPLATDYIAYVRGSEK